MQRPPPLQQAAATTTAGAAAARGVATRSAKQQHSSPLPSPQSDDLGTGPDQGHHQTRQRGRGIPPPQQQQQQHAGDVIMIDASDSEAAGGDDDDHSQGDTQDRIEAAAARLASRAAAAAAAAQQRTPNGADAICISDSDEDYERRGSRSQGVDQGHGGGNRSSGTGGSSSSSDDDEGDEACSPEKQQQQQQQRRQPARSVQQPGRRPQQQQRQQSDTQTSIDRSSSEDEDEESESGSSSGSESSPDSDSDDEAGSRQRRSSSVSHKAAAAAAGGGSRSMRRSSRAAVDPAGSSGGGNEAQHHQAKAAPPAAAAAAGGTPRRGPGRPPKAEATTPSRPVRSCTQTPQRSTHGGAAGAGGAQTPGLSTPLGKLSLNSSKGGQQAPGSARITRSSSRPAAPAASTRTNAAAAATTTTPSKKGAAAAAAAAAATTPKPKRGGGAGGRGGSSKAVVGLSQVVVEDEVILVGDDVYLQLDDYEEPEEDEEEEACEVCSSSRCSRGNAMLECSTCLRGFHMRCLKPALKSIPEGDWLCPSCNAGEPPEPPSQLVSLWQKLLYGRNEVALVHVLGLQRGKSPEGEEEDQLLVRYYILPQETHLGRQQHHAARELFLGTQVFIEPATAVAGRGYVHPPSGFQDAPESQGNDVYLCEYEYDEAWKRFRKRRYRDEGAAAADGGGGGNCPMTPAGLRLTPSKGSSRGTPGAGGSGGGRRLFGGGDSSGSDGDYDCDSDDDDDADGTYRPELHHFAAAARGGKGGAVLSKRKRHGQLPGLAAGADKFVGLGAADVERDRAELKDSFARLHAALSLGSVPDTLPCRDEERKRLGGFLNRALTEDGGVLYICGVPGTGKTALVMELLRQLRPQALQAGAQLVAINCLQLPTPQHVFSRLWEKLSGQHLGPARACEALMQSFGISGSGASRRRHYSTIIVLDEIDMLMTRDQAVLYQVFDWPNQPGSRLAVIGISNTHDLDQRVLPRIASRLDQAKLAFAPYNMAQLQTIVGQRLQESGVGGAVEDLAVMLACRKVASETGDVRRTLELLRRAVEIARAEHLRSTIVARTAAAAAAKQPLPKDHDVVVEWQEGSPALVKRPHMTQAQQEMFGALHMQLLRSRSMWEKVLLVAVVVEARATGRSAVVMQSVVERASSSIASLVDLAPPALGVLQHCLVRLCSVRLLLSDGSHIKAQVALNVDKDDVAIAIKEDDKLTKLQSLL